MPNPTMQAIYFTSFGLLMSLMLRKQHKKLKINSGLVSVMIDNKRKMEEYEEREVITYTPEKKNKKKKNKKGGNKMEANQDNSRNLIMKEDLGLYRKIEEMEIDRKIRCQYIGKELEGIKNFFIDELKCIIPYNGDHGQYKLIIPIPGTNYSQIPITFQLTKNYPFQLPPINILVHNLHPVEKQKLKQIMQENKKNFIKHQEQFYDKVIQKDNDKTNYIKLIQSTSGSRGADHMLSSLQKKKSQILQNQNINCGFQIKTELKQMYLQSYYPYILNLTTSIAIEIFSKNHEIQLSKKQQKIIPIPQVQKKNSEQEKKEKIIKKQQMKKQILANMLEEIFYDHEEENNKNNTSFAGFPKVEEGPAKKQNMNQQQNHHARGRYILDYQELQKVGEGGFGRVYKCRNRVDSNIYAVKKMVINYNDSQSRKMLKQVALLSKLNHPNIVRYHQSWLQDTMSVQQLIKDMSISEPSQIQEFKNIWNDYQNQHKEQQSSSYKSQLLDEESVMFGDDIIFEDDDNHDGYSDIVFVDNSSGSDKTSQKMQEKYSSSYSKTLNRRHSKDNRHMKHKNSSETHQFPFKILYIVMEYCGGMTLRDFINKRFHEPNQLKIKLIRGILEGLSYIHSRRIIHRDLKPANIFLIQNTNKVKIGDFGLATVGNIENNPYEAEIIEYSEKTKGVGTTFYRAPEQLKSSTYDEKIDIYSLGIIMLEMFYQFDTNMERYDVLNEVTKTYKLPKDFNNNQQRAEYGQSIRSCIFPRSEDRPSVHKLLETYRNKYFTQLVSVIANPKHFQFYQLINHLFRIKNQSGSVMKQVLLKDYITSQFIRVYQNHRGVLFTPLALIPVTDFETLNGQKVNINRKEKYLLLSERGVVLEYSSNTFSTWIRYAKETIKRTLKDDSQKETRERASKNELRRYTFEKVAEFIGGDVKTQFSFKERYVTAFDICYSLDNGEESQFLCEILKISFSLYQTINLTHKKATIYMCHSSIFIILARCWRTSEPNLYKFLLSITDEKFKSLKNNQKLQLMQKFKVEVNFGKKLIGLMQMEFDNADSFLEYIGRIEQKNVSQEMLDMEISIREIQKQLRIFKLEENIKWKVMIPSSYCNGFYWNIGPIKGFTAIEEYAPGMDLCNLHIETAVNISEQNEADVAIWSNGEYLKKDILQIVQKCWQNNVTVKWYEQSFGEKDETCRNNIILKKKLDRVYLMIRKNKQNSHMLGYLNQKKHSDDDREGCFILKDSFDFDVLASMGKQNSKKSTLAQHH